MKTVSTTWYWVGIGSMILLGTEILGITSIIPRVSSIFGSLLPKPTKTTTTK